jgi:ABC-type antimicrobial peptide transport system ATPase subunit
VANVHAVEDVSFTVNKGQTLSLVGDFSDGFEFNLARDFNICWHCVEFTYLNWM